MGSKTPRPNPASCLSAAAGERMVYASFLAAVQTTNDIQNPTFMCATRELCPSQFDTWLLPSIDRHQPPIADDSQLFPTAADGRVFSQFGGRGCEPARISNKGIVPFHSPMLTRGGSNGSTKRTKRTSPPRDQHLLSAPMGRRVLYLSRCFTAMPKHMRKLYHENCWQ